MRERLKIAFTVLVIARMSIPLSHANSTRLYLFQKTDPLYRSKG